MGRKIPAKKHRGVKDPIEQQARRFQSIKSKINAPPTDPDEQPVPRSLTRLFSFHNKHENNLQKKKKKSKPFSSQTGERRSSGVTQNPIACLKKLPGESGRGFSLRINSAIRTLHDPREEYYPQELEADDVKGEKMAAQRVRRQRKRARAAAAVADGAEPPKEKLTRGQKLTLKKNANKLKAIEEARCEVVYERVAFGDVTHAPPALPAPRRAPLPCGASRPGRRDLLLSSMLAGSSGSCVLPAAELQRRERARLDVVAAYRQLKRQRQAEQNNKRRTNKSQ